MNIFKTFAWSSFLVVLFGFQSITFGQAQKLRGLGCAFVGPIQGVYFNQHIKFSSLNGKDKKKKRTELEEKVIKEYVERLDGSKLYLHASDVADIKNKLKGILSSVEKRPTPNCKVLLDIQKLLVKRVKERVAFAEKYLGKSFKFQKNTALTLDPDKRKYPKDKKEADEFQKSYIQFQISNFLTTDMKLSKAKSKVIRRYERNLRRVDEDMTPDMIYASYLDAFAHALDPHSSYFSADAMEDFRIQMALSLEGIGATLSYKDGFTVVEQLIPGGAAARDGRIKPQDKIVAVGQGECSASQEKKKKCVSENVVEVELRNVVKKIRGKKGTKVRLLVLRESGGEKEKLEITLVRDKVKLEDEAASITYLDREIEGKKIKVGLINLPSFYSDSREGGRTAAGDMKKLLKDARKKKVDSIVLDFSSNGGGSLDDAVKIAGLFFKTGAVVKQSAKRGNEILLSDEDDDVDFNGPLIVLTSRISASASEIVAGTLQDYKRAVVVGGDHTFGKGTVQSVIPLPSGLGAAKVTVGMFYTPGGNSTQHRGVDADIVFPSVLSNDEIGEKTLDYSLPPSSLASFLSRSAYVKEGDDSWSQVTTDEIKKLKDLSNIRIAESEDFKKILEDIKKSEKKDEKIKVAETLKAREESKKKEKKIVKDKLGNRTKADKLKEYLARADVQEAVNVAVDLAALRQGIEIHLGAKYSKQNDSKKAAHSN